MSEVIGGGSKKVLYTLATVRRIGLLNSAKALKARNACKACGLGMGGQLGGMTNEKREYPSVCNKSIQAQSTDIQPPIPREIFDHSIAELKQLSPRELEHLGRLNFPLFKAKDSDHFSPLSWEDAYTLAAERFAASAPEKSFFYSSGRSSNEAGFLLQLFARLYGTNNVNNCSYYCHQATGEGLKSTIGTGTSTVELEDLAHCDLLFVIGANPASNHPRLVHQLKGIRDRGGDVVVINPAREPGLVKFAVPKSPSSMLSGGTEIASYYLQPNIASDLWAMKGIAKGILELGAENRGFIESHTHGFEALRKDIESITWSDIEAHTQLKREDIEAVSRVYAEAENVVFAWGMGITHHLTGTENVEYIANLALLRGMVGKKASGLLPLRGHSNVQGVGTIGVKPVLAGEVITALEEHLKVTLPEAKGMDTMACLEAADSGDIDNALIMGGNLYSATPDSQWAGQALDRVRFKLFMTTTLNQGHLYGNDHSESLILPVTARDEEFEPTTQESMFNYVRLSDGGIKRLDNVRPESQILAALAGRLVDRAVFDFATFASHSSIRKAIAACIPGMEDLKDIEVAKKEFHIRRRIMHTPEFKTASGRAHFITHQTRGADQKADFPFKLMTVRSEGQFNSIIYEESDSYRSVEQRSTVLMSAGDMTALSLKEGDRVSLKSESGAMHNLAVKTFDLPPGNLMTYYPEANVLVGRDRDPRSKTPAFKSISVALIAAN
ncbi:FdhF/YdeP family oxidoreductase [Marinobacter confluentis]|uniref:FdhF/YdeP family oxidoreductase n=1 Tax=Marinobacter confluentis TaxID=1697557 RepID=A0A4Z1BQL6_9GAMM|nr:FdhF/YdeP family oxidoreductase [Marinobacter confluentis]TGN39341.1 FdhF/YdeP family oxidoreductase [Marinobacter confluentis]